MVKNYCHCNINILFHRSLKSILKNKPKPEERRSREADDDMDVDFLDPDDGLYLTFILYHQISR